MSEHFDERALRRLRNGRALRRREAGELLELTPRASWLELLERRAEHAGAQLGDDRHAEYAADQLDLVATLATLVRIELEAGVDA
jgi:hypothetical protein